jgi:hypothetical protein
LTPKKHAVKNFENSVNPPNLPSLDRLTHSKPHRHRHPARRRQ